MDLLLGNLKRFLRAFCLHRQAGVSLVELLISVAMLGGVALTVAELMRQTGQVTSKTRTRYDESEFLTILHNKLMQPAVCEKNFVIGDPATKASFTNDELLDTDNSVLAQVGDQYGENQDLTLTAISSTYEATSSWIKVNFTFTKAKVANLSPQTITRSLMIFAEVDATGDVERCLGSSLSVKDSVWDLACKANELATGGRDVMVEITDPDDPTQTICVKKNLNPEGCGLLTADVTNSFSYNSTSKLYDFTCVAALKSSNCPVDFFMRYGNDGSAVCAPLSLLHTYQPFNETDNAGAFVSGPAVLDCTGRYFSGLQDIDDRIRVFCDNVAADTPTPTNTATATNTPTPEPTIGRCTSCLTRPSSYTLRITKGEIPVNTTTQYEIRFIDDCDGIPADLMAASYGCESTAFVVGEDGPVCGIAIANTGGTAGTYTLTVDSYGNSFYPPGSAPNLQIGAACTAAPIYSGTMADGLYVAISVDFSTTRVSCGILGWGGTSSIWSASSTIYSANPSVYSGVNSTDWRCMAPD